MKQKGLCRVLLLILFATCAVVGRAQEVLRSDSVTGVDAGKESLKIQPSASEVTPEKVGARLALTDTLVTGVGLGTGISAMYVRSLTDRLVLSVGGFYDRLSWNGLNENRFGINLLAGYQLTDRVSLYAYGSKAFFPMQGRQPWIPPMPWMNNFSSRFGGMVHFKVSDAVSVSLSVEETSWKR